MANIFNTITMITITISYYKYMVILFPTTAIHIPCLFGFMYLLLEPSLTFSFSFSCLLPFLVLPPRLAMFINGMAVLYTAITNYKQALVLRSQLDSTVLFSPSIPYVILDGLWWIACHVRWLTRLDPGYCNPCAAGNIVIIIIPGILTGASCTFFVVESFSTSIARWLHPNNRIR